MIITIQRSFIIGGIILLTALLGCARLPDYARPRTGVRFHDSAMIDDAITYRQLTRADFKAATLPPDRAMHETSINAYTCCRIRPGKDSRFTVSRARYGESVIYIGSIRQIAFEAIILPGCSWWNPALPAKNSAYVAIHPTDSAAIDEITATVNQMIRSATDESLKMHTAFDEDTSLFHSPKRQRWWLEKVERELAQFQPDKPAGTGGENTGYSR